MTRILVPLVAIACAASPASAQHVEFAPLTAVSFTTAAPLDDRAPGIQHLEIARGFSQGLQVSYLLSMHTSVEALWTWQYTGLTLSTASNSTTLFHIDIINVDSGIVYTFKDGSQPLRPFVFAGLGAGFLQSDGLATESKLMWNAGTGVKWFFQKDLGMRFDVRYRPTRLNTSASDYCAPFSFCQASLRPVQIDTALLLRF
jgi:hypothetical protein